MISEVKATLPLAELIEGIYPNKEEKGLYTNIIERIDPVNTIEYTKKAMSEQMNLKNVCSTCIQSRSVIQSTQNKFKLIGFTNNKKEQAGKAIKDNEFMTYLVDIPVILNNNGLSFKNNIEYI